MRHKSYLKRLTKQLQGIRRNQNQLRIAKLHFPKKIMKSLRGIPIKQRSYSNPFLELYSRNLFQIVFQLKSSKKITNNKVLNQKIFFKEYYQPAIFDRLTTQFLIRPQNVVCKQSYKNI